MDCEVGLRRRSYNVLSGSVLSVWSRVESILATRSAHNTKMQVVRLRTGKFYGKYKYNFSKLKLRNCYNFF